MSKEKVIVEFEQVLEDKSIQFHVARATDMGGGLHIREGFNREDYELQRTDEWLSDDPYDIIAQSMEAYRKIPLVKNTIDLMVDLVVQGVDVVAANKSAESFYKKWFNDVVSGYDRTERIASLTFRAGTTVAKRWMGKAEGGYRLPMEYTLINPLIVNVRADEVSDFIDKGSRQYSLSLSQHVLTSFQGMFDRNDPRVQVPNNLTQMMRDVLKYNKKEIPLDPETISVVNFKKDDWDLLGTPICECIIDDLDVLRKLRLADLSALDGAISKIRLWKVGHLDKEFTIFPSKNALARLREALAHIVPGGSTDIIWGPAIDFKESQTDVHKFLGPDKYVPTVRNILFGLGLPNILHGFGQGGGMTNNMIEMKIMVQRLKYMRQLLIDFWKKEFKIVQKAMGFSSPAILVFDYSLTDDEATVMNILLSAAAQNIVSDELVQERLNAVPEVERVRIQREWKEINNKRRPPKASSYHDANMEKRQQLDIVSKLFENGQLGGEELQKYTGLNLPKVKIEKPKGEIGQGRPNGAKDKLKRKKKRVVPIKSSPMELAKKYLWAIHSQDKINDFVNSVAAKANLTDETVVNDIKVALLTNLNYPDAPSNEVLASLMQQGVGVADEYRQGLNQTKPEDKEGVALVVALLK